MSTKKKILILISTLVISVLACGQLEVGVEDLSEKPSPVPPTKTLSTESLSGNIKQADGKNPEPTGTEESATMPEPEAGRLDCSDFGEDSLDSIACNVQDSLISRNTSPLLSFMPPEFALGYWLSEWTTVTPEYVLEYFQNYMLPPDPSQLAFTSDPDLFPDIGRPIRTMLGPDDEVALVIYSEGWNEDGQGAAIFFITGNEASGYQFRAMLVAGNHFEMPPGPEDTN